MSKIQRTTQKIFGGNAPGDSMAVFGSMKTGTPIYTDNIEDLQSEAYGKAWEASIVADEAPFLEEMNGVQYGFSKQIAYILQSGMAEYDSGTEYYKGDWCKGINPSGTNSIFESLTDNNVGNPLTDTTNWKELDFASKSGGASLPVGFIGTCAFGIDESKGLARYLNGSIMAINANTQGFVDKLSAAAKLYPSLLCTEEQWQATVTLSAFGQCGQFVLDEAAGTVRLPKIITPIQGLTDLASLGELVEAGLPNIEGTLSIHNWGIAAATGCFTASDSHATVTGSTISQNGYTLGKFDASRSSAVYGKSQTVQQEAVQYTYFIQVATGVEEEVSITNTFEINNPYTLLQPIWSDKILNNLSWLRSNGQSNPKAEYQTVYDLILTEYNSAADETETVGGVEITFRRGISTGMKVTTDKSAFDSILEAMGTAWYYVIDTANEVFYLPQSNGFMQFGGEGDFAEAGLPNIEGGIYGLLGAVGASADKAFYISDKSNNNLAGASDAYPETQSNYNFDASRSSAVYGKSTTVQPNATKGYLYFYVGETIQNANIVNIGRLEEQLIEKTNPSQAAHAAMPSDRYIDLTLGASGTSYTAPADGWFACTGAATANWGWINMSKTNGVSYGVNPNNVNTGATKGVLPVCKGDTVVATYGSVTSASLKFIYAQGAQ